MTKLGAVNGQFLYNNPTIPDTREPLANTIP
jgi:hypothetical protein